jgi:oxaloacetate decarboxylase gamma subunit
VSRPGHDPPQEIEALNTSRPTDSITIPLRSPDRTARQPIDHPSGDPHRGGGTTAARDQERQLVDSQLLLQGTELMLLGMGIVFGFLGILVVTLRGMSWAASRLYQPAPVEAAAQVPIDVSDQRRLAAVISAAIASYRGSRRV